MFTLPKRLLALTLLASALAVLPACMLRAQWVQADSGMIGDDIAALIKSGAYLFVGTSVGVFRSVNNGASWTSANNGLTGNSASVFAQSGANLFVATDSGVFLSADNGTSWNSRSAGLPSSSPVNVLAVLGTNLFAGTKDSGVFRSKDSGRSWISSNIGLPLNSNITGLGVSDTNLFAGTHSGVFLSVNEGKSWSAVDSEAAGFTSFCTIGTNIFALVPDSNLGLIFRSTDNGASWIIVDSGLSDVNISTLIASSDLFAVGTTFGFYGNRSGLFRSTDSGTSWTAVNDSLTQAKISVFAVIGNSLFVGTSGDGFFHGVGYGWPLVALDDGLMNYDVFALALCDKFLFAGTAGGNVFRSTDCGTTWKGLCIGLTSNDITSFAVMDSILFAGTAGAGVFCSTNHGLSWTQVISGLTDDSILTLAVSGTNLLAGTARDGIFLSSDSGSAWTSVSCCMHDFWDNFEIVSLTAHDSNVYASEIGDFVLSTDSGLTWANYLAGGSKIISGYTCSLLASGGSIFAGEENPTPNSTGAMFRSTDNGATWFEIDNGLPISDINGIWVIGADGPNVFVSPSCGGVYFSNDGGSSWTNAGLGCVANASVVDSSYLIVSTATCGVFRRPLAEIIAQGTVAEASPVNDAIQTYPNPFSQSTQISFTPESAGYADISIVNLLGEEVARIFSGELDAGEHNFTLSNTAGLPDGIYECLVRMNGRVETLPMVLLH